MPSPLFFDLGGSKRDSFELQYFLSSYFRYGSQHGNTIRYRCSDDMDSFAVELIFEKDRLVDILAGSLTTSARTELIQHVVSVWTGWTGERG